MNSLGWPIADNLLGRCSHGGTSAIAPDWPLCASGQPEIEATASSYDGEDLAIRYWEDLLSNVAMIQLSQSAIRELKRLEAQDPYGSGVVRLAIAPGGCSGLAYDWQFRQATKPADQILKLDQLKVVIAAEHLASCEGLAIDYSEDLMGGNFRFTNPQAQQTCGCGVSFSLEAPAADQPVTDCTQAETTAFPTGLS